MVYFTARRFGGLAGRIIGTHILALLIYALLASLKALIAHGVAPYHLVGEVVDQGKDQAVNECNRKLRASRGDAQEHARRQENEQQRGE